MVIVMARKIKIVTSNTNASPSIKCMITGCNATTIATVENPIGLASGWGHIDYFGHLCPVHARGLFAGAIAARGA